MCLKNCLVGVTFCTCYLASYLTNKYVLSVLRFTYPTLFQGWQTLIGGLLLHVSWKLGWAEINSTSRFDILTWLPASVLFVGIIYAGSRALSRLIEYKQITGNGQLALQAGKAQKEKQEERVATDGSAWIQPASGTARKTQSVPCFWQL